LPIEGVTANNERQCAKLLTEALGPARAEDGVKLLQDKDQWYARVFLGQDVTLRQMEEALKGSEFSIRPGKLRLFGHVILEIDLGKAPAKELIADLESMKYVSVAESEKKNGILRVTVDMPYPVTEGRSFRETVRWDTFQRNDFASAPATRSERPATAGKLPSYDDFHRVAKKHNASLKDIRWSEIYACRPLGCVAVPDGASKETAAR
jgi:hypothetical protein